MADELEQFNDEENLEAENEFMKFKLMLERNAKFGGHGDMELSAEIENMFLKNILEFEKQFDESRTIKIVDKLGRPTHFKLVEEIPDNEIEEAWKDLSIFIEGYGISLDVSSPNVSHRELYRFTTEELFQLEIEDVNVPGMMQVFIYDQFHPDLIYENTRTALEECMELILQKKPLEWVYAFNRDELRLNEHFPLPVEELQKKINRFKLAYDEIEVNEISVKECVLNENESVVNGMYSVTALLNHEKHVLAGNWKVTLKTDKHTGSWYITGIEIEGIHF